MDQKCAVCRTYFTQINLAWMMSCCDHNICSQCLKHLKSSKNKQINCKECNQKYQVDQQTLQQFPKNINIVKLLRQNKNASVHLNQSHKKSMQGSKQIPVQVTQNQPKYNNIRYLLQKELNLRGKSFDVYKTFETFINYMHGRPRVHMFELRIIWLAQKSQYKQQFVSNERLVPTIVEQLETQLQIDIIQKTSIKLSDLLLRFVNKAFEVKNTGRVLQQKQVRRKISSQNRQNRNFRKYFKQQKMLKQKSINSQLNTYVPQMHRQAKQQSNNKQQKNNIYVGRNKWLIIQKLSMSQLILKIRYKPNLKQGQLCEKQFQQCCLEIKKGVEQKVNSLRVQFTPGIEGIIYNYAQVTFNPNQIKVRSMKDIKLFTIDLDDNKSNKKEMKIQFVKSDQLQQIKFDKDLLYKKQQLFRKQDGMKTQRNTLHKVKSNQKLPKAMIQQPKKSHTPPKLQQQKNQNQLKRSQNLQFAERMLNQFIKSTDTLDITGCQLNDQQIIHIVSTAASQKFIKCLKLSKNKLTNYGLMQLVEYIPSVTNINISFNGLSDQCVDVFIQKRQQMPCLRIINLSNNKINQRKVKTKVQELRKFGIITTL